VPQIETWPRFPAAIRDHLVERMRDRKISLQDLNQLRLWIESRPEVPEEPGTKILARSNCTAKASTQQPFLLSGQTAIGRKL